MCGSCQRYCVIWAYEVFWTQSLCSRSCMLDLLVWFSTTDWQKNKTNSLIIAWNMQTEDDVFMTSVGRVSTFEHTTEKTTHQQLHGTANRRWCMNEYWSGINFGIHQLLRVSGSKADFWLICDGYIMHGIETNINSGITSSPYQACTSTRLVFASGCTNVISSLIPRPIPIYTPGSSLVSAQ